jgi:hypothetical protein
MVGARDQWTCLNVAYVAASQVIGMEEPDVANGVTVDGDSDHRTADQQEQAEQTGSAPCHQESDRRTEGNRLRVVAQIAETGVHDEDRQESPCNGEDFEQAEPELIAQDLRFRSPWRRGTWVTPMRIKTFPDLRTP